MASKILNLDLGGVTYAQASPDDHHVGLSVVALLLGSLITAGLFITWMYKGVQALRTRGPGHFRHDPGWAIGAWFVPALNLVGPKMMIDDAWRSGSSGHGSRRVPWFVHLWWATFVLSGVLLVQRWTRRTVEHVAR